jgi:hypothetical protein
MSCNCRERGRTHCLPDLLNCGRCEFGMGESASVTELTPFSRDMDT